MPGTGSAHQIRQELQRQDAGQPSAPRQQPSTRQHKPHSLARPGPGLRRQDTVPPPITPALPDGLLGMLRWVRSLPRRGPAPRGPGSHGRAAAAAATVPDRGLRGSAGLGRERARLGTARHLPRPRGRAAAPPVPAAAPDDAAKRAERQGQVAEAAPLPAGTRAAAARGRDGEREGGREREREGGKEGGRAGREGAARGGGGGGARGAALAALRTVSSSPPADNKAAPAPAPAQAGELPAK